jgi:hypothetical protein
VRSRRIAIGLLDTVAALCATTVGRWPMLEGAFVAAGCAVAGTTAGRAWYRRACARLITRLRSEDRAVRTVRILSHSLLLDVSETAGYVTYF